MKMNTYKNVVTLCLGMGVLALGGCAAGPATYDVRGLADPVLNRDVSGKSLSVVVRLYQLKQPTEFSKLAFDSLASGRPETELLGADLIEKSEVVVLPGTQHISTEKLSENANYLGVVAFFSPARAALLALPDSGKPSAFERRDLPLAGLLHHLGGWQARGHSRSTAERKAGVQPPYRARIHF